MKTEKSINIFLQKSRPVVRLCPATTIIVLPRMSVGYLLYFNEIMLYKLQRWKMKKLVLILGILSTLSSYSYSKSISVKQQEFVNQIFNKPLFAYGRTSWNTILTPTSITESPDNFSNPDAHIEKHNCKLLENENNHIKYFCNVCHPDILNENKPSCSFENIIYRITNDGFIEKQSFTPHEQEPYSIDYLITKP